MSKNTRKIITIDYYYIALIFCILAVVFIFSSFTGILPWADNVYNSYSLQAESWLHGRLDLGMDYPHLELAIFNDKYFVSFPPLPSYVLLPFVLIFGSNTPDNLLCIVSTLIGALYSYKLCKNILGEERNSSSFLLSLIIYVGCNTLFFICNGWVWFIAQNFCFTFTILALYHAQKGNPGWSLFYWACAVGCRPFQIIYLPILIWLMIMQWKKEDKHFSFITKIKREWYKGTPCFILATSYCILNYARFGSITEFGHNYLPEFTRITTGQFNITYLAENLSRMLRLPIYDKSKHMLNFFYADGVAFYLVNPIFLLFAFLLIYQIFKKEKKKLPINLLIFVLAIVHIISICLHRTLGGWHFGNRYTCDLIPVILLGIALAIPRTKWTNPLLHAILMSGFALNLVGTIVAYNYWY